MEFNEHSSFRNICTAKPLFSESAVSGIITARDDIHTRKKMEGTPAGKKLWFYLSELVTRKT